MRGDRPRCTQAQKIKDTKANMMKLTDNQLETTTKRTIMENEQMSSELAYQSHQTEVLLQKNLKLMEENASYRRGASFGAARHLGVSSPPPTFPRRAWSHSPGCWRREFRGYSVRDALN
jgi:hypothetical protein